jgi:NTE family protein
VIRVATAPPRRVAVRSVSTKRRSRPYTAFVLSGGASLGALQVGMLRAVYESGIAADLLVGTSAGALNAAFVASRPQTVATANELARVWRGLQREDIFPISMRTLVGGLCGRCDHLVPDRGLRRLVARHVEFQDISDAAIPLHVVAFDLDEGCEVLLSEGPAVDVIAATAAVPGLLPPVRIGERQLIDGGVVNNTPISHAVALGAERIFVFPTQAGQRPLKRAARGALEAGIQGLTLLTDRRLEWDVARYSSDVELILLPAPNPTQVQPIDFDHSSRLIREALTATRAFLARRGPAVAERAVERADGIDPPVATRLAA